MKEGEEWMRSMSVQAEVKRFRRTADTRTPWCGVYLLVVLDLVVQDGSVGLFSLLPGDGDGVLSGPGLPHRCHQRRTCEEDDIGVTMTALACCV